MNKIVLALVVPLVRIIIGYISPIARQYLVEAVRALHQKMLDTENKMDDLASTLLANLCAVDLSDMVPSAGGETFTPEVKAAILSGVSIPVTQTAFELAHGKDGEGS